MLSHQPFRSQMLLHHRSHTLPTVLNLYIRKMKHAVRKNINLCTHLCAFPCRGRGTMKGYAGDTSLEREKHGTVKAFCSHSVVASCFSSSSFSVASNACLLVLGVYSSIKRQQWWARPSFWGRAGDREQCSAAGCSRLKRCS